MKEKLQAIADKMFRTLMPLSADERGIFRILMTVNVDGTPKPLLLVGNAHPQIEDGDCIAVLNPDASIMEQVAGGVAYSAVLKEIVAGKCDAMVHIWIDAYKRDGTSRIYDYTSRTPAPAKFEVR